jgi:hyperosmotically inducible protein
MQKSSLKAMLVAASLLSAAPFVATYATASTSTPTTSQSGAEQAGQQTDDSVITGKVKAAIGADPQVSALKIHVNTKGGTVVLTGSVPSADLSDHVIQLAASVEGVRDVKNHLKVDAAS